MPREQWVEIAKQNCYRNSPYGKRVAIHALGMAKEDLPMPEFSIEDEAALRRYVSSKWKETESKGQMFDFRVEGEIEMRWIEAWHKGIRLLPDPVVPV